jgi:hypothetical protein
MRRIPAVGTVAVASAIVAVGRPGVLLVIVEVLLPQHPLFVANQAIRPDLRGETHLRAWLLREALLLISSFPVART